ncbi:hypothetical protein B0I35DRAFT_415584 [Stachybotrys elegans]|uniref:Peptidase M14 domain-containing protein n=1 Tax=Stachybotrys elegans TaxID=80388 RepID=A0A8K0SZX9_9HYPO|nr:hypothetical protein B0I35DRAFT_415584 [Stachybotrys elegans]
MASMSSVASDQPGSEVFHGTAPFSEPETNNVADVMFTFPSLTWFLDLHSFSATILYGWGDDSAQTTAEDQSFSNATYDGKRGMLGTEPEDSQYGEYILEEDLRTQMDVTARMASAMNSAGSIYYTTNQSAMVYPVSGGSTDYAMSQYYRQGDGSCGKNRMHGLTLEFGINTGSLVCPFYPDKEQYHNNMRQVGAGLMELLLNAAGEAGEPRVKEC